MTYKHTMSSTELNQTMAEEIEAPIGQGLNTMERPEQKTTVAAHWWTGLSEMWSLAQSNSIHWGESTGASAKCGNGILSILSILKFCESQVHV